LLAEKETDNGKQRRIVRIDMTSLLRERAIASLLRERNKSSLLRANKPRVPALLFLNSFVILYYSVKKLLNLNSLETRNGKMV